MNRLTGSFAQGFFLRASSMQAILRAQHASGALRHRFRRVFGDRAVDVILNEPTLAPTVEVPVGGLLRLRLLARVHYQSRPVADATAAGEYAVADVDIALGVRPASGNPTGLAQGLTLVIDASATQDVAVQEGTADPGQVRADLLSTLREEISGQVALNLTPAVTALLSRIGARFDAHPGSGPGLSVGASPLGWVGGDIASLGRPSLASDWAYVASRGWMDGQFEAALADRLGGVPAPLGAARPVLLDDEVCAIDTPFGCVDRARRRVYLEALSWQWREGSIRFSGTVRHTLDAFYVPDVTMDFDALVTAQLGTGGEVDLVLGPVNARITTPLLSLLGPLFEDQIGRIVHSVAESALGLGRGGLLVSWLDSDLLSALVQPIGRSDLQVQLHPSMVAIQRDGLVLQGALSAAHTPQAPQVELTVLRPQNARTARRLSADTSWVPGGTVAAWHWDFGDGQVSSGAGRVVVHDYAPGTYRACVTLETTDGRRVEVCRSVAVGAMHLEHRVAKGTRDRPWRVCDRAGAPLVLTFVAKDDGLPIAGVEVILEGPGYQLIEVTDQAGACTVTVQPAQLPWPPAEPGGFLVGTYRVWARKPGFMSTRQRVLSLVDCDLTQIPARPRERLKDFMEVLELMARGPSIDGPAPPRPGDIKQAWAELGVVSELLARLVMLSEAESPWLGVDELLAPPGAEQDALTRLDALLVRATERVKAFVESGGASEAPARPGGDGDRGGDGEAG